MTAPASAQTPLALTSAQAIRHSKSPLILLMMVFGTVLAMMTSACAGSPPTSARAASSSVQPNQLTATSQATHTTTATTSPEQVLAGLCTRNCFELKAIADLPPCEPSAECWQQVHRADRAVKELRQDMVTHGIDRQDFIELDDAITNATTAINSSDLVRCPYAIEGSTDDIVCSIATVTAKLSVHTIALVLGADA